MTTRARGFWAFLGIGVMAFSATASAQKPFEETKDAQGFRVVFPDDPLGAGGFGANDVLIPVMKHSMRVTLIRPRTEFVDELVKSVEKL